MTSLVDKDRAEIELEKLVFGDDHAFSRELQLQRQALSRQGGEVTDSDGEAEQDELENLPDADARGSRPSMMSPANTHIALRPGLRGSIVCAEISCGTVPR